MSVLPDPASDFGARVRRRLSTEQVIWLITVSASGTPQPNPVWFLAEADADSLLIYNDNAARRLASIDARPRVAAHFDSDGRGGDIVVLTGDLARDPSAPAVNENPAYLAKYADGLNRLGMNGEQFAAQYSVALRLTITKVRGF